MLLGALNPLEEDSAAKDKEPRDAQWGIATAGGRDDGIHYSRVDSSRGVTAINQVVEQGVGKADLWLVSLRCLWSRADCVAQGVSVEKKGRPSK